MAYRPESIKEAVEIMGNEECTVFAGGTDLMVKKRLWSGTENNFKTPVVFISDIKDIRKIEKEDRFLKIGAACTCSDIIESQIVPEIMKDVIRNMASPAVRNTATLGGNICNSSPAGDSLPYLYAVEARLVLESTRGKREVEINNFIKGPGKNAIEKDEILTEVKIPLEDFEIKTYRKVGTRKSTSLSKLSFIGLVKMKDKRLSDIRLAFGAVGPVVVRDKGIEQMTANGEADIAEIIKMYSRIITPIDDQRSTASYRKEAALKLLSDFLSRVKTGR